MVDSPSPPPTDPRSSRSRSPSNSSRSSAVRNGTSHLNNQSQNTNSKEYLSNRAKAYSKDPIKIVQVANIAPQATKEQMQALFGYVGKIEDIRLYPSVDIGLQLQSKICFVKFYDANSVGSAQHLTNTVFIDRALIVIPYLDGDIPDETRALELLGSGSLLPGIADPKLPQHVTSQLEGIPPLQVVITKDPMLVESNLPLYPPLAPTVDSRKIEEIRRTIMVCNIDSDLQAPDVMDYFMTAGEVKYFRFCTRDNDPLKFALIEFTEQPAVLEALQFNGQAVGQKVIRVYHATQAIIKPQAKSNEAAQKEIEEAMSRQAQNLLTHGLDSSGVTPSVKEKRRSRSRSRSHGRRSRSRGRRRSRSRSRRSRSRSRRSSSRHRDRYRSKTKRSRSKSREKRRSRSRRRSRSKGRARRTRSRSHARRSRSRSKKRDDKKKSKKDKEKDRDKDKDREKVDKNKDKDHKENGEESDSQKDKKKSERRSRSPKTESKKRRRSRSRSHSRRGNSPSHEKKRSKSKKKKKETSDREGSVESVVHSRSNSQDKRSKKDSPRDIEYDDKSDISRCHGDIDDTNMITS